MQQALLLLEAEDLLPRKVIALELFARSGLFTVAEYHHLVEWLEMYEIDPLSARCGKIFFRKAKVLTTDSIQAVRLGNLLRDDYNFIVIDNPDIPLYCDSKYCEHFDLFPYLVDRVADYAVFMMNVVLSIEPVKAKYPGLDIARWLRRRSHFYGIEVEQVRRFTPSRMVDLYRTLFAQYGAVKYATIILRRHTEIGFLILCLDKKGMR